MKNDPGKDDLRLTEALRSEKRRRGSASPLLYAGACALFSAIAVFGLFLGYFTGNAPLGTLLAGGEPIMRGSLFGVIVEVLRGSIAAPEAGVALRGNLPIFLYSSVLVLVFAVLVSLALTVLAFLRPAAAKQLCVANGILVALAYGIPAFECLLAQTYGTELFGSHQFDLPTSVTALSALFLLVVLAIGIRRGRGALNAVLLLVTLVGIFAFSYPGTPLSEDLSAAFSSESELSFTLRFFLIADLVLLCLNLAASASGLFARGSLFADAVRFGLWTLAALLLVVAYLSGGISFADFVMAQPLPAATLLLPPIAGLFLSAFGASLYGGHKKRKREKPETPSLREAA